MAERTERTLIHAAGVFDAGGVQASPGALLLEGREVVAAGTPQSIGAVEGARRIEEPGAVLLPGLVNAHAHLDLTPLEPRPFGGEFEAWLQSILDLRADQRAGGTLRADTQLGIELSLAGGVAFVGDIAGVGQTEPALALRESALGGVSFIECFGLGDRQDESTRQIRAVLDSVPEFGGGVRVGISPHAPYTCGPEVYADACSIGRPVATHLAESLEEEEFLRDGSGPFRRLSERMQAWNDGVVIPDCHPVEALRGVLDSRPLLLVHLNYVGASHIELIAERGAMVAYCPRASDYFGHPRDDRAAHRYREMLDAGIPVALGTDSRTCLDTPDRIGVLDEMRHLYKRDGTDPLRLLAMATVHGAAALELDAGLVTFDPGAIGGVLAVDVSEGDEPASLAGALARGDAPRWVLEPGADS